MKRTVVVLSALMLVFGGLTATGEGQSEGLKVGSLMAFTGDLREFGPAINNGIELAAQQLTTAGLAINVITEDTETNPIAGVNAARKLVNLDRVVAIIGALSSGITIPVAESVTIPNRVVLISPASTSPVISNLPADRGQDFLFRTVPSDAFQGALAGRMAAQQVRTASVLYVNNPYGQGLAENFKTAFESAGGRVLAMVPHEPGTAESYNAELWRALTGNPEVLAAYSYPEQAKIYLREAIEFFNYRAFLFSDGTKSQELIDTLGASVLEGLRGTAPGSATGRSLNLFLSAYNAAYGELPPLPFISNAYDAMAVIGLAAYSARAKGLPMTSVNIRDQLRSVSAGPGEIIRPGEFVKAFRILSEGGAINYEGAAGAVDFDENGDGVTPIEIWQYTNGGIETIELVSQ